MSDLNLPGADGEGIMGDEPPPDGDADEQDVDGRTPDVRTTPPPPD